MWSLHIHPNGYKKNFTFFLFSITISRKSVNFRDKKAKNCDFYKNKKVIKIDDVDFNKILVSKKEPYRSKTSFQYFIGYNDNGNLRPLCIMVPQTL